jgi:hypothetical protein
MAQNILLALIWMGVRQERSEVGPRSARSHRQWRKEHCQVTNSILALIAGAISQRFGRQTQDPERQVGLKRVHDCARSTARRHLVYMPRRDRRVPCVHIFSDMSGTGGV